MIEDEEPVHVPIQAPVQNLSPAMTFRSTTPPPKESPKTAPGAPKPIRRPYGWKPEGAQSAQAPSAARRIQIDDFPLLTSPTARPAAQPRAIGTWGNGIASIREAKDLPAPKPKISEEVSRRQRREAARALFNQTGFIESEDVTWLISDGQAQVFQDEQQEDQDDFYTEEDDEWNRCT